MKLGTHLVKCGDALNELASLPSESVDCIVTSPPYYRQRNYEDSEDQLGPGGIAAAYVERLVEIMGQCRRVLKETGTLWLNIGDKYERGQQLGMPWRVALAMSDDGWTLRSDIIWHKPNAMPSSVKSRPTVDHEYVFFFTKSKEYFYNADAIREPHVTFSENSRMRGGRNHFGRRGGTPEEGKNKGENNLHDGRWDQAFHPKGRNKRTVWSIPAGQIPRRPLRRLPGKAGRNLPARGLSEGRYRPRSLLRQRHDIAGRAATRTERGSGLIALRSIAIWRAGAWHRRVHRNRFSRLDGTAPWTSLDLPHDLRQFLVYRRQLV